MAQIKTNPHVPSRFTLPTIRFEFQTVSRALVSAIQNAHARMDEQEQESATSQNPAAAAILTQYQLNSRPNFEPV